MANKKSNLRSLAVHAKAVRHLSRILMPHSGVSVPMPRESEQLKEIMRASHWFFDGNLLGIAVGLKSTGGVPDPTGKPCLKFYVRKKLPKRQLKRAAFIPEKFELAAIEEEFTTDIELLDAIPRAHLDPTLRPLRPGGAFGNFRGTRGTIGLVVRFQTGPSAFSGPLLLSCSHVLCPSGFMPDDVVEQPPDPDGLSGPNRIGVVATFTTLTTPGIKGADAALALLDGNQLADGSIPGIGRATGFGSLRGLSLPQLRALLLIRTGAGTGLRVPGMIDSIHGSFPVHYPSLGGRTVIFNTAILYRTTALEGDSGAAIVNAQNNQVVGQHIAGASMMGVMIPIDIVLSELEKVSSGRIVLQP